MSPIDFVLSENFREQSFELGAKFGKDVKFTFSTRNTDVNSRPETHFESSYSPIRWL